ncbi:hypothetical protein OTU49_013282 [Cherax quadricarinatus]|uniref:Phospholipid scramblase n=1 Tax=Cherax quadricarinatus TaxID=27406 RepID=A0AAW0VVG5_CHEQU
MASDLMELGSRSLISALHKPVAPPGLEYLAQLDQVAIQQIVKMCEVMTALEFKNKYILKNSVGQEFLFAQEHSTFCSRHFLANVRPFQTAFTNNCGQEVMRLNRPLKCANCCSPCCLQVMEVSNLGQMMGSVHQEWSFCTPWAAKFTIKNPSNDILYWVKAPCCVCSCGGDVIFQVFSADCEVVVGRIIKTWRGFFSECATDADNFTVTFPQSIDVRHKALILGAAFLIDILYFER